MPNFKQEFKKEWITSKIDKKGIQFADDFGKDIANDGDGLTTSQIRNYFGEAKRIQAKGYVGEESSFLLLRPKLAYLTKRAEEKAGFKAKGKATSFKEIMDLAHDGVDNKEHFQNFMDFLEAILAYHKAHGGKE